MVKILVVDDEPDVRYIVKKVLEKWGCKTIDASSGRECLEKLNSEKPDLILLDVMLPDMSGWNVLREIKGSEALKSIPIVMLTSVDPSAEVILGKEFDELADYIIKPYANESLLTKLRNIFAPFNTARNDRAVVRA